MNRFARWLVKHRVVVVIVCLALMIPSVFGMMSTKVKYDLLYYLPEDLDTIKGQNILTEDFGKGAFSLCVTEGLSEGGGCAECAPCGVRYRLCLHPEGQPPCGDSAG